jgi:hypothetical protein
MSSSARTRCNELGASSQTTSYLQLETIPTYARENLQVRFVCTSSCVHLRDAHHEHPFLAGQLTTSLELFVAKDGAFHVLQQRAPVAPGAQKAFAAELAAWLLENAVAEVIVVSGLPSTFRHDPSQPICTQYLSNSSRTQEACSSLGWSQLDQDVEQEEKTHHGLLAPWPTIAALEGSSIAFTLASMYVNEGNNLPAALLLTGELVKLLTSQQLLQEPARQLRQPCSWASVFGAA